MIRDIAILTKYEVGMFYLKLIKITEAVNKRSRVITIRCGDITETQDLCKRDTQTSDESKNYNKIKGTEMVTL